MPLSLCRKLNIGEPSPTNISLQLADRSIVYPEGILEDIPIKIGEFYVPCDIVILEMEEDSQIPIILGRPFLATAGAIIDVKRGKIKLEIGEETIEFDVFKMTKDPSFTKTYFRIDAIQSCVEKIFRKQYPEDPLEASLTRDIDSDDEDPEVIAFTNTLNSTLALPKGKSVRYDPLPPRNLHFVCALREEDAPS